MSGFDDDWLALREPADARSRDAALATALAEGLRAATASDEDAPLRVLDLGSGTGSNFRCLVPRLGARQVWTLIDHDETLLGRVPARLAPWAEARGLELRHGVAGAEADAPPSSSSPSTSLAPGDGSRDDVPDRAAIAASSGERISDLLSLHGETLTATVARRRHDLATELDALPFAEHSLVSGSALLDLAGADWLDALASRCEDAGCAVYLVLSYDGRTEWTPALEDDTAVAERFDRHQRQDKGLGPALGPAAAAHFAERLRERGFAVSGATSDWRLDGADAALQRELASGFAGAAREIDPAFAARADAWLEQRHALVDAGRSTLLVGHLDVLGLPGQGGVRD